MNENTQNMPLSMDEIDRRSFNATGSPFEKIVSGITLDLAGNNLPNSLPAISLNGQWELYPGDGVEISEIDWQQAMPATVPGSIHTALYQAGRIPDPTVGVNQKIARLESYRTWIYRRTFSMPVGLHRRYRLEFYGICNCCSIWLNGQLLGQHEGMFGGPEYEVTDLLKQDNELVVRLEPIPFVSADGPYPENNKGWLSTVVINNVYGWHYSNMPSLGIWRSVEIKPIPDVEICNPYIATKCIDPVALMLHVTLNGPLTGLNGVLNGEIKPLNFDGQTYAFAYPVQSGAESAVVKIEFAMPDAHLWWPVDLGDPNLYELRLAFTTDNGESSAHCCTFGIRTIDMAPLPDGPSPDLYNWTFVVNGHRTFVKGAGWCTADAMLDFSPERLSRFLSLARDQHCQMMRAWGSGMPETDEFYDLCDHYGIMIIQEWPTAWNSHRIQPYDMLEDTVRRNTLRLRNHPSLVMWGGGNESNEPFGEAIDMMGRLSIELDGTRPFHRGEPWGGSRHDYTCYWDYAPLDFNLKLTARFFGEFGLACMPSYESVLRYLPLGDQKKWPVADNETLRYHTPIFGYANDVDRLLQYAHYFIHDEATLEEITIGTQLAQAVGLRHPLERARIRWPECSGALYYKMNDNFPSASWACVDWYGAPKIGYYFCQDAFAPLSSNVLFDTVNAVGTHLKLPVFLLDDADELSEKSWEVVVRAYDRRLAVIQERAFSGTGSIADPLELGKLKLTAEQTRTSPLLVTSEVRVGDQLAHRNLYFINYEADKGCLFRLPRASLRWTLDKEAASVTISNDGDLPAVGVQVKCPGHLHEFTVSDNYFWLNPGESANVKINRTDGITVDAWNSI
jgi:beta-mannosidase